MSSRLGKLVLVLAPAALAAFLCCSSASATTTSDVMMADYAVEQGDLPQGWTLEDVGAGDDTAEHIAKNLEVLKKGHDGFSFKGQKLTAGSKSCLVYIFTCADEATRKWVLGTLELNSKNWQWSYFPAGDAVIMAVTKEQDLIAGLKEVFSAKAGIAAIEKAAVFLGEGKVSEAEKLVKSAVESSAGSRRVCMAAADLYLNRFSPPKSEAAAELYSKAIDSGKAGLDPADAFSAYEGRARAFVALGKNKEAAEDCRKAVELSAKVGLKAKARALAGLARAEAACGNAKGAEDSLDKAFAIELAFGSKAIYESAKSDKGLAELLKSDKFKDAQRNFEKVSEPDAFADPEGGALKLSSAKILVAPPVVKQGMARPGALEEEAEAGLKGKFGSRGAAFNGKKVMLSRWGLEDLAAKICESSADCILGSGSFDLAAYKGNRLEIPGLLNKLARKAEDIGQLKGIPDYIAFLVVDIADSGSGGDVSCAVKMALVNLKTARIAVYVTYAFQCPEKSLKSKVKGIAIEAVKKAEAADKKIGK